MKPVRTAAERLINRRLDFGGRSIDTAGKASKWKFHTSGSGGVSLDVFAATGILADVGGALLNSGKSGSVYLMGMDPLGTLDILSGPANIISAIVSGRSALLVSKAVVLVGGKSLGLSAGGNAYLRWAR